MASTPITTQSSTIVEPLRDLAGGAEPKASKTDFASNVSGFFKCRKMKVSKNPPPPARITKAHFGLQTSSTKPGHDTKKQRGQSVEGGPADGEATCESTWSFASASSSADEWNPEFKSTPTCNDDEVPPSVSEAGATDGIATPPPWNNSNWFPPPPLTPVPVLANEEAPSPPVTLPRNAKTSVTAPGYEPPVADHPTVTEAPPLIKQKAKKHLERTRVQQHQLKADVDGRSVGPWGRAAPVLHYAAIDFSGSRPQRVPPQHLGASAPHQRTPRSIRHRSSKSQSGREDLLISQDDTVCARANRPLSLAISGRTQSQHRGGRHRRTYSLSDDSAEAALETHNDGSRGRRSIRMNSDLSGMIKAQTRITAGAASCDDNDSAGQFVQMGCNVQQQRQHPHSSTHHHQRPSRANQGRALAAAIANADMMTQSLTDCPGYGDTSSASAYLQHRQQQRICQRIKAVHLTDSGLALSPQDAPSLSVYHHGRRIFSSSSSNIASPGGAPPGGGLLFQIQVCCPSHLGGKVNADEAVWTDGRMFEYQAAPAHAYSNPAYMLSPQHQLVSGQRRSRHHHPTQPSIVPAGDDDPFLMGKRLTSTKVAVPHSGRPQVLVAGHNRGKKAADLSTLVSLPVEEQPWFHGRLSRAEAESLLHSAPPGSFLVRTSETSKAAFSLSIRHDRDFLHMKITYDPKSEAFILGEYSQPYPTVPIMVHHFTQNLLPVKGTKPVLLKYPICRTISPLSLQTT